MADEREQLAQRRNEGAHKSSQAIKMYIIEPRKREPRAEKGCLGMHKDESMRRCLKENATRALFRFVTVIHTNKYKYIYTYTHKHTHIYTEKSLKQIKNLAISTSWAELGTELG